MKIYCCCCTKQIVSGEVKKQDEYVTQSRGSRFMCEGVICGFCAEDLDENGLFPEERND